MSNKLVKALITETVKERLQQIKEKAEASKSAHSKDVIKILEDQAKVLDKMAAAVQKEYEKHDFAELKKKATEFASLRDAKLAKAEALKKRYAPVEEAKKKPSAGMTKKEKSAVSKKAHAGKDIGKKGKGFEKVAKAAEKQYGSKEAGQKVAAAAMWKAQAN